MTLGIRSREAEKPLFLNSCVYGKVISLDKVEDDIFSMKILGDGYGVIPEESEIYSPAEGYVTDITNGGRAVSLKTDGRLRLLIHFGINLCRMEKNPIDLQISIGDRVERDSRIALFDCKAVLDAKLDPTVCVIVCNSDNLRDIKTLEGMKSHRQTALEYVKI